MVPNYYNRCIQGSGARPSTCPRVDPRASDEQSHRLPNALQAGVFSMLWDGKILSTSLLRHKKMMVGTGKTVPQWVFPWSSNGSLCSSTTKFHGLCFCLYKMAMNSGVTPCGFPDPGVVGRGRLPQQRDLIPSRIGVDSTKRKEGVESHSPKIEHPNIVWSLK